MTNEYEAGHRRKMELFTFFSKIQFDAAAPDHKAGAADLLGKQTNPKNDSGVMNMMLFSKGNYKDYEKGIVTFQS